MAELKVQNQQFIDERDVAANKLVKSKILIVDLRDRETRSKFLVIAEFKSSSDFQEAVENVASKYFSERFDFYKRQLAIHHPKLGINLDAMDMDHELLEKEGRETEEKEEIRANE